MLTDLKLFFDETASMMPELEEQNTCCAPTNSNDEKH